MTDVSAPNVQLVPVVIFDELADMAGSELKVTLAVIRKTYHEGEVKPLSLSLLMTLTGLSRNAVIDGVNAALKRGIIERVPHLDTFEYRVRVVQKVNQPVQKVDTLTTTTSKQPETLSVYGIVEQELRVPLTPMMANMIDAFIEQYGKDTVLRAVREARAGTKTGQVNLNFVRAILQRWERDGEGPREVAPVQKPEPERGRWV